MSKDIFTARHIALAIVLFGGALLAAGVGMVYPPAGLVVAGALLIAFGLIVVPVGGERS